MKEMKEIKQLIQRIEYEICKTPSGELRNLLCDANIMLHQQILGIEVLYPTEIIINNVKYNLTPKKK